VDRAHFESRFTSDREASSLLEPSGTTQERAWRRAVEEETGKVGKNVERSWRLGPKQDPLEILEMHPPEW
jgi:8-oxo-dGTP pyrophosphatase MutT (NUDIX family)